MEKKTHIKKLPEIINDENYKTITVAVIGNVDAGKSTTIGVLTSNTLDDGNGKSRSNVLKHQHEQETGRTSSITYKYFKEVEGKKIYNFIDLAGHDRYLKTTINGLVSGFPDLAIVCISEKLTRITKEHLSLAITMEIPVLILFTKKDIIPEDKFNIVLTTLKKILNSVKKKLFKITESKDISCINENLIPYIHTSNVKGEGIELIHSYLSTVEKKKYTLTDAFTVDAVFNVVGHGIVVSGITGGLEIKTGDILHMGPMSDGEFTEVRVKSIHNDYKFPIDKLLSNKRGCLCIKTNLKKKLIRPGIILRHEKPVVCKQFIANVKIYHHSTTINKGYEVFINCGMIREPVKFIDINSNNKQNNHILINGDTGDVLIEFQKNLNYVELNQQIIFRDGSTKGVGKIISIIKYNGVEKDKKKISIPDTSRKQEI